jgi:hypothetical protein
VPKPAAPKSAAPNSTASKRAVGREGAAQTSLWGDVMPPTPVTRRRKTA